VGECLGGRLAGFLSTMTALNGNECKMFSSGSFFFLGLWGSIFFFVFLVRRTFFVPMDLGRCSEPN